MTMWSAVLHSGTQSAAGSLAIRTYDSHFQYSWLIIHTSQCLPCKDHSWWCQPPVPCCQLYPLLPLLGSDWPNFPLTFLHTQHIPSAQLLSLPHKTHCQLQHSPSCDHVDTLSHHRSIPIVPVTVANFLHHKPTSVRYGHGKMDQQISLALWLGWVMVCPTYFNILLNHIHSRWRRRRYAPLNTRTNLYNTAEKPPEHYHFKETIRVCTFCKLLALIILHPTILSFITPLTCVKRWQPHSCSLHTFLQPVTSSPHSLFFNTLHSAFFP